MTAHRPDESSPSAAVRIARKRLAAASILFAAWVILLIVMGALSANRPGFSAPAADREGAQSP